MFAAGVLVAEVGAGFAFISLLYARHGPLDDDVVCRARLPAVVVVVTVAAQNAQQVP